MSTTEPGEPTEEELRAAYDAQMSQIRVEQVIFDQISMLVELGMRRTGLQPGTEAERDAGQVRLAIEGIRALLPVVEQFAADQLPAIRQVLSQMQMAFVRIGGAPMPEEPAGAAQPGAGAAPAAAATPPPAPSAASRLWIPGQ